jgi:hypothetical protein
LRGLETFQCGEKLGWWRVGEGLDARVGGVVSGMDGKVGEVGRGEKGEGEGVGCACRSEKEKL